ncbi:MAG: 2-phosphosulfolactate phosphatase [Chloroflexia bacterium]|jgi:2-phosphosulfolactate phosphatase|nr:2-phosphosulfolactate phosphatase [Chloroflexia bacterium]
MSNIPAYFNQHEYGVRCEWGLDGIRALAPITDVFVIVDVLSFSTCVDIAANSGAFVYPYRFRDDTAQGYADSLGAVLAGFYRSKDEYSLSPASLVGIPAGTRLVLPSPNGATLTLSTGNVPTFAGCLRNARAVAEAATKVGRRISVIPAGERWPGDTLRPAIEDMIGAGAIIHHLIHEFGRNCSPEAEAAEAVYAHFWDQLYWGIETCSSGRELVGKGFEDDIGYAADLDVSQCAPRLVDGAYVCWTR